MGATGELAAGRAGFEPSRTLRRSSILLCVSGDRSLAIENGGLRGPSHSVHGPGLTIMGTRRIRPLTCNSAEPPIGIEPMTYALRGTCELAAAALAAPIAPVIALTAFVALGLSGHPVHEPV